MIIKRISKYLNAIGVSFLVAMMLVTVADVLMRYFFNKPIVGSVEITEYCIAIVGFSCLAWCAVKKEHAKVDLLVNRFSKKRRAVIDAITHILSLSVVPLVAWQGFVASNHVRAIGKHSYMLEIPAYPFYLMLGVGFSALSLVILALLIESIKEILKNES